MNTYNANKAWSDKFLGQMKAIIGINFIGEIKDEDCKRNTDLIVLKLDATRFACRVRRLKYYGKYKDEFTIRSKLPSGCKTELTKIIEGWGDYIFYGFSDYDDAKLKSWFIGDLKVFRIWFLREHYRKNENPNYAYKWMVFPNKDGSSHFHVFNINHFPTEFVVARG